MLSNFFFLNNPLTNILKTFVNKTKRKKNVGIIFIHQSLRVKLLAIGKRLIIIVDENKNQYQFAFMICCKTIVLVALLKKLLCP